MDYSEITKLLFKNQQINTLHLHEDHLCEEYFGCDLLHNDLHFKFRKAKLTPKKKGHFVTLWKRNEASLSIPYNVNDFLDYLIVVTEDQENKGFFIFPKNILVKEGILNTEKNPGKRGFRVYANWVSLQDNKQALKTKQWQDLYFIDYSTNELMNIQKLEKIIKIQ